MIIYNVTTRVDPVIAGEWLTWLREEHVPEVLATGCFTEATILHLLETDEADGPTYAVQYRAINREQYGQYIRLHASTMRQQTLAKWGQQMIAFRSVLEVIG